MLIRSLLPTMLAVVLAASSVRGQVIQLPTFNQSSVSTTVMVPDRGSTLLGGVNRSSAGRVSHGVPGLGRLPMFGRPFNNNSIGRMQSAGSMRVTATIHDFDAMDRMLLDQAAARRPSRALARDDRSWLDKRGVGGSTAERPALSLAEIRRLQGKQAPRKVDDARAYLAQAQRAEAEGKRSLAKMYYQMAARRSSGAAKARIAAHLRGLAPRTSASRLAQAGR